MVLAKIRMIIPRTKRNEALKILRTVAEQCKVHSGCLSCHVYADAQEDNVFMFEEMWRSDEDLSQHLRSERYHNVLLVMEMALNPPEISFDTIASSAGIETIEKARSSARRF
jgi:quinol monooxygenase YgiN